MCLSRPIAGLLLVFSLLAALRSTVAALPLERDEGEYAYLAQSWRQGVPPYRDHFDQKPPGVFAFYAATQSVAGESPEALHWAGQVYTFGTLALLFLVARRLGDPRAGVFAAMFCGFALGDSSVSGNALNTETIMLLPLVAGFLFAVRAAETGSGRDALLSGAASAAAILCKQPAAPNLLFCLLMIALRPRPGGRAAAMFVSGCAAVLLPVVCYFAAVGAIHEFWDCVVGHNLKYAGGVPLSHYPRYFWKTAAELLRSLWPIVALAAVGLVAGLSAMRRLWVAGWLLASAAGTCAGGYFREHYFIQMLPAVGLLSGFGACAVAGRLPESLRTTGALLLAILPIAWGVTADWPYYRPMSGVADVEWKMAHLYRGCVFSGSPAVARYIAEHSEPGEAFFVDGSESQLYFYARRPCASRYLFVYPLMRDFPDARDRQRAVIGELEAARPRFIVRAYSPSSFLADPGAPPDFHRYLDELLEAHYTPVAALRCTEDFRPQFLTVQGEPEAIAAEREGRLPGLMVYRRRE